MSDNLNFSQLGFAARAVHTGSEIDKDSGAIKRPITMANSCALPYDPTDMNWSSAAYIAVYRLLNELFNNEFGVETTLVDTSDPANVEAAVRPNTKLVHIETPGNGFFRFSAGIEDVDDIIADLRQAMEQVELL